MDDLLHTLPLLALLALAFLAIVLLPRAWQRLQLSRAKHRSLAGHSRMAKRVARLIPGYAYDEARFFGCDGAPAEVQGRRRVGLQALAELYHTRFPRSLAATDQARASLPDLAFTGSYRVPFQFSPFLRQHLRSGAFLNSSEGVTVSDLDGNRYIDLAGSYGVNLFGYDFYKTCMAEGAAIAQGLGPVLGSYHPVVLENVERLKHLSGQDAVTFHMSGTEAVMQAVRLARYHTRKTHLVRFCGAYHGWWDDVQPGPGNPANPGQTYTLADLSERSLAVLRSRDDIACVLVNPLQALHPNAAAPSDSALVDSSRRAGYDKAAYTRWLQRLREVCSERGIALIFDEVFLGFRLAPGGAQEYFGVRADLVTYGKTLGGGLPVGVVCGQAAWMKRYREDRPVDICFARGTFNAHPYVMATMKAFLDRLESSPIRQSYIGLDDRWNRRLADFNTAMTEAGLPLRAAGMVSIWTLTFAQPSRYNWMLQFYLRAQGLHLSWVGSGRLIFSHNFAEEDFQEVLRRCVAAGRQMVADGWWWDAPATSNRLIRRGLLVEMLRERLGLARPAAAAQPV